MLHIAGALVALARDDPAKATGDAFLASVSGVHFADTSGSPCIPHLSAGCKQYQPARAILSPGTDAEFAAARGLGPSAPISFL